MRMAELASRSLEVRMEVARRLLKALSQHFTPDAVPAKVAMVRDRVVRQVTKCVDPYREVKLRSNEEALKLLPLAERRLREAAEGYERFRAACLIAAAANAFELGVLGYSFNLEMAEKLLEAAELAIDDVEELYSFVKPGMKVIYLADNAGEIGFDKLLIGELKELGAKVALVVKGSPVLEDALIEDARFFKLEEEVDEVLTTPDGEVGLDPSAIGGELLRTYQEAELVIAKGMGHYETLTERPPRPPVAHLLKAKCGPIARSLGVEVGSLVVKVRKG